MIPPMMSSGKIADKTENTKFVIPAEKLCNRVSENKLRISGKDLGVTISLGVGTYPADGKTPAEIIDYADSKLYSAKENGRNRVGK